MVLAFKSMDGALECGEQYFRVVLLTLIMLAKAGHLILKSMDETLVCDHSNEIY